ncbi:MAG: RNA polymerase sigma factor, partial [Candidatus Poribacteria bacterium]
MRTEDGHIISKCLNGEPAAFGLLVDKYKAGVYSLAFAKLGNFHDAQDVTQEVFIKAFKNLHTLKRWDSFLSWLCSITTNLCNKFIRSQSRRPDREFIEDQESEIMDTFSVKSYNNALIDESVRDAFNSLPEIYRKVLSLYYLADMDSVEIAKYLGISPTAVRQRLSRARAELKEGVLAMLGTAFHEQRQERLQAEFTFRVVEAVKRINPNPISPTQGLPFGLSLATGIMLAVLGFGSHFSIFNHSFSLTGYLIPNEMPSSLIGNIPITMLEAIPSFYAGGGNGGDKG